MFGFLFNKNKINDAAHGLFSEVMGQSRIPFFYSKMAVEDNLDGRFDLMSLHMIMLLHKLDMHIDLENVGRLKRILQEIMFDNLDLTIREIGVGDLGVGKKIKTMAEAFYGRMTVYQEALQADSSDKMSVSLRRNLYREAAVRDDIVDQMSKYVFSQWRFIESQNIHQIVIGKITFLNPESKENERQDNIN